MEPPAGKTPISINRLGIMTARLRIIVAASACLLAAGSPAVAQDAAQQQTTPPARNGLVGPPQLSNFSLNGTVTRAAPAPAPVRTQPAQKAPARQQSSAPAAQPARQPQHVANTTASPPRTAAAIRAPAEVRPQTQRSAPAAVEAKPSASAPAAAQSADLPPAPVDVRSGVPSHNLPILPWIVAALVAAAAAGWLFWFRNRPRESFAGLSSFDLVPASEPAPEPLAQPLTVPAQPKIAQPSPAPTAPPAGVVSTRLRPWLEIEFRPDRAVVDDNRAAIAFEIFVSNSGTVPARDVLLEASLFNAGPMQDQQIQLFFDNPVAKGDRVPVIPPRQKINVNTAVFLARDQVQPIEIDGRPLFVPMIAFNALYRWSGGEGQTSASYLVGKETSGEKLAPFRLDLGPRVFRGLDAREHQLKIRR
jgi:hypothetical protein